jgi:hypothetical protein
VSDDQERMLADALRAQATSANMAPVRPEAAPAEPGTDVIGEGAPAAHEDRRQLSAVWVLALALLLGLAAGAVAAIITLT